MLRIRHRLRCATVYLVWLGLFAALLLILSRLPSTLLGAETTSVNSKSVSQSIVQYRPTNVTCRFIPTKYTGCWPLSLLLPGAVNLERK